MYKLTQAQRKNQAARLKNLDLRLVVGFLKTSLRFIAEYPAGPLPYLIEGHRTAQTQALYYASGRTMKGPILTNKMPGNSKHERSPAEAIDFGFLDNSGALVQPESLLKRFWELWQEHSTEVVWGGFWTNPHDAPHIEVPAPR